jgi:hypothetical protein
VNSKRDASIQRSGRGITEAKGVVRIIYHGIGLVSGALDVYHGS